VENVKWESALYEGSKAPREKNPEVPESVGCKADRFQEREGAKRRRCSFRGSRRKKPERRKRLKRAIGSDLGEDSRVQTGVRLVWGEQTAEAPIQSREVLRESARAERRFGNGSSIPGLDESSGE